MKITSYILFVIFLSVFITTVSQQDLTLMNLSNVQQVQYINPAFRPQAKINIGVPGASSTYFNHYNTVFTPKDLFSVEGNTTTLRVDHLKKMWKKRNHISVTGDYDFLHFGFAIKKSYFSFNITEHFFSRLTLPGDLLRLPLTGNASSDLENGILDLSGFGVELDHYRKYAVGFQREINERLSVGGKLKYLYGMENIQTRKSDFTLETDPETYDWKLNGEFAVSTSGIYSLTDSIDDNTDIENGDISGYIAKRKNRGLGIDIGATYEVTDKLTVGASVVDLGFIRWKNDNRSATSSDGSFVFTGVDFTNAILAEDADRQDSIDAAIEGLQNEFEESFSVSNNTDAYTTSLLSRFYLSGSYKLIDKEKWKSRASALIHGELFKGRLRPSLTLGYTQDLGKVLQATASYSMTNRSFNNLGLGMSLNLGFLQFYVVTDNIMAANLATFTSGDSQFSYPYSAKNMHIRTGVNLTFGMRNKDKDGDGIKDKKDNCPDVAGPEIYKGCPDSDKDSIPDNLDLCPSISGVKEFRGCPDTDLDGIKDSEDNCPTEKGTKENKGCPDTDEDGIIDSEDVCPKVKGVKAFNGCPDTDGDGLKDSEDKCPTEAGDRDLQGCPDADADNIPDGEDACPNEAGELANKGCPWGDKDGDGVKDNVDNCPEVAGPADRQGCPLEDADKDGVMDANDECPTVFGTVANKGCPEIKEEEQEILNTAFSNLEFESGKAIIKQSSYPSLQALSELLIKKPEWKLKIAGHTDSDGSAAGNLKLSKSRAQAVADYLKAKGIENSRLLVEGYGEAVPIADNTTAAGKQKNRRVEMTVVFN